MIMHISNSPIWHVKLITQHRWTGIRLYNSYMVGQLVNVVLHGKNAQSKTALQISMQKGLPDDNEEFQVAGMESWAFLQAVVLSFSLALTIA